MTVIGSAEVVVHAATHGFDREVKTGTEPALDALQGRLDRIAGEDIKVHVRVSTTGEKDVDDSIKRADHGFGTLINKADLLGRTVALIKPAALIVGLGLAAQLVATAAAGGIALAASIAPAAGAYVALGDGALAAQQGLGVLKLALNNVSGATDQFTKALALPTPAVNKFKDHIAGLVPDIVHLRNIAQGPILGGLTDGIDSARKNLGVLNPIIRGTALVIADLERQAGKLIGSKGFGEDLATVGARNTRILATLGGGALHLADALRNLIVEAGPLTSWLAKLAAGWADSVDGATKTGRQTGALARIFDHTRDTLSRLFSIAGSLATAFWNVGKAAFPLGNELLGSIDKTAAGFAKWTASVEGKNSLAEFFANARGPVMELGKLLHDVVLGFAHMGQQPGLQKMIEQVRTQLLPVLLRVVNSTTAAFGPKLLTMITALANAFEPLAGTSGPLSLYVSILTDLAKAAAWIEHNVPGASQAISVLVGTFAVSKAIGFAGSITGVTKAVGLLRAGSLAAAASTAFWTAAMVTQKVGMVASAVATRVMTAAQIALDAAMDANPIGLVVTAIAALAAGFIYAYKHSEEFRRITTAAFDAVKNAVGAAVDFITGHWKTIVEVLLGPIGIVVAHWHGFKTSIVGIFSDVVDAISGAWHTATSTAAAVPGKILGFFKGLPGDMLDIGKHIVDGLVSGIRGAAGAVYDEAKHLADGVLKTLHLGFLTHSPSKVTHEIGLNVGQGLADGLSASAASIVAAAHGGLVVPVSQAMAGLSAEQKSVVAEIEAEGRAAHATSMQVKAAIETGLVESNLKNLTYGDADSKGWRQERTSIYGEQHATSVKLSAADFFAEAKKFHASTAGELAAMVQRPAAQYRGRYAQVAGRADQILGGTSVGASSGHSTSTKSLAQQKAALDKEIVAEKAALNERVRSEQNAVRNGTAAQKAAVATQVAQQRAALATQIIGQKAALADSTKAQKAEAAKQTKDQKTGTSELNALLKAIHSGSLTQLNTVLDHTHTAALNKTVTALSHDHSTALKKLSDELVKVHKQAAAAQLAEQKKADAATAAQNAAALDQYYATGLNNQTKIDSDVRQAMVTSIQDATRVTLDQQAEASKTGAALLAAQAQTALDAYTQQADAVIANAQLAVDQGVNGSQLQQAQLAAALAQLTGNAQIQEAQLQANLDLANAASSAADAAAAATQAVTDTSTPISDPGLPATSTAPIFHITINGAGATAVDIASEISWALKTGAIPLPAPVA